MAENIQTVSIARETHERILALRDVRHHVPRPAGRARRPQARAAAHPVHDVPRPAADLRRPAEEVRPHRRRRDGQVPPARRRGHLRGPGPHGPAVGDARARWSTGRGTSARSTATRPRPTATPRPSSTAVAERLLRRAAAEHGADAAQLRQRAARAGRPAGRVPEPAGQRLLRHRRRHGHQHPAAQPRRSPARLRPPDRQARGDHGPAHGEGQGAGLPARRQDRAPTGPTLREIYEEGTGSIKVQAEWKLEGEGTKKPQIVITSIPYGVDKGKLESDIGGDHRGPEAAAAARPDQRVEREGRAAHRPGA